MRAKASTGFRGVVVACPFGCREGGPGVDMNGYCGHLQGFTLPGDETRYEFLDQRADADVTDEDSPSYDPAAKPRRFVNGRRILEVQPGDVLVPITVSSFVYRKVEVESAPKPKAKKNQEAAA
jgi:hypothetical protein